MSNHLNSSKAEHKSRPPLRWIANMSGSIGSWAIFKVCLLEEDNNLGIKHKIYGFMYDTFMPIYFKYGSFYRWDIDMSGAGWNDYDENGTPYWEKLGVVDPDYNPWYFEDENTGDAFRIIKGK